MGTKPEMNFIVPKITWRAGDHYRDTGSYHVPVTLLLHKSARSVQPGGSDAILRLVQLLCGSTITRSVRDKELAIYLGRNEGVREKDLSESS